MKPPALLVALLLAGCAQPAPFFPRPAEPAPVVVAAAKPEPAATPAPRPPVPEVRPVGEAKEPACATCWSAAEILAALAASGLLAWALAKLYRAKAGKDGR